MPSFSATNFLGFLVFVARFSAFQPGRRVQALPETLEIVGNILREFQLGHNKATVVTGENLSNRPSAQKYLEMRVMALAFAALAPPGFWRSVSILL